MKTNRIHSIHQRIKRCWLCNSKLNYYIFRKYKFNWVINEATCNNCIDYFYVAIENENNINIKLCQNSDDINEEYIITAFRCLDNKSYYVCLQYSIDNIISHNILTLYEQSKLSLNDFRKINFKSLLKLINSFRKNKMFL